jgi:hypothetical protein
MSLLLFFYLLVRLWLMFLKSVSLTLGFFLLQISILVENAQFDADFSTVEI